MKLAQRLAIGYIRTKLKLLSAISKKKAARLAFDLFRTPIRKKKKPLPKIFAEAQNLQMRVHNMTIKGWRWNQSEKKILIVHGFESSAINFDRYIRPLMNKGYEILAFDAPAHGHSSGKMITAPIYKDTIKAIDKKYGPIHGFIAHSFGGLAASLALEEINHTADHKLVLIAPATETTTAINSFFKFLKLDDPVRIEFEKLIIRTGGVSSAWYSIRRAMKNIRARVLWLHDENDDTTPLSDAFQVKADNRPNLKFHITKGLGHRKIYRDNKVAKEIENFF